MTMYCYVCGKKLNIFSDYKQITIDGEKKEICAKCNREREKQEVKKLLLTREGKQKVSAKGSILIGTGIFEILLGIFFTFFLGMFLWIFGICFLVIGCISIGKGISYKIKVDTSKSR